jgi:hypothetical protein
MAARFVRLLTMLGIAGLATWMGGAAPAMASPQSWIVTNPNSDGTVAASDGAFVLRDDATGDVITCSAPDQSEGSLASGTYEPDESWPELTNVGSIWAEHNTCTDAQGAPATVFMAIDWRLYAASYDAGTGRTTGEAIPFHLISLGVDRPGCQYVVAPEYPFATADFTYTHSTSTLEMTSRPQVIYDLQGDGCDELALNENDPGSFTASYTITPAVSILPVD